MGQDNGQTSDITDGARVLNGNETVITDADGDSVVIYSTPEGRVGLGTQRAEDEGGFAVLLDEAGVADVILALASRTGPNAAREALAKLALDSLRNTETKAQLAIARAERAEKRLERVLALTEEQIHLAINSGFAADGFWPHNATRAVLDLIRSRATENADSTIEKTEVTK